MSSQATTGSIRAARSADASAATATSAATSREFLDTPNRRAGIARRKPFPLITHCIGLLAVFSLVAGGFAAAAHQAAAPGDPTVGKLNNARAARRVERVERSAELDRLAARYLDEMLASRTLTPPGYGDHGRRLLSEDVSSARGPVGDNYRYTGVVAPYGIGLNNAIDVAIGTRANGPALFEPALEIVGIASATIPEGEPWLAPPPGGFGADVELAGHTLVVIVTAGKFRDGS